MANQLKLIRKKDEIHALNGVVVDGMDSNSSMDAPSVRAVKEATDSLNIRVTNIERNGVVSSDTLPVGSEVLIDADAYIPSGWEVIDEAPSISNPNLLINGDFNINQRGNTTYIQTNTWKYSVDRWRYIGLMSVVINDTNTITLSKTNNSDPTFFVQTLEKSRSGKHILSFKVKAISGVLSVYIEGGNDEIIEVDSPGVYEVTANNSASGVVFRLDGTTTSAELEWAKLETGQAPTPFIPRLPGEELSLCRRYYRNDAVHLTSWEHTNTYAYFGYNYEPMRIAPTFSYIGFDETSNHQGGATKSNAVQVLENTTVDRLTIRITFNDSNTAYYRHASGRIILDAEIY